MDQFHGGDFIPLTSKHGFKFNGLLGANTPTVAAAGAYGHVVKNFPGIPFVKILQSRSRAILYAGQTSVAFFIDSIKRQLPASL
jgi:hypothetical protein